MDPTEKIAQKYFGPEVTDRDRAIFEGAITLGSIFHQFSGVPLHRFVIPLVKETIEKTMSIQPYIEKIDVEINDESLRDANNPYDYSLLSGDLLELKVISKYGRSRAYLGMKFVKELEYPLMFIQKIEEL
ncbi:MAG: dihydroneopterin aldolase family protein [Candidatus Helarchaeota archaeon]